MPLNRRDFLKAGVGAAAALTLPFPVEACDKRLSANERAEAIAKALREYEEIAEVIVYPKAGATKVLVHWEWCHFNTYMDEAMLPLAETSQTEAHAALKRAMGDTRIRLRSLMQEGMVEGRRQDFIKIHRDLIRSSVLTKLALSEPHATSGNPPDKGSVDKAMLDMARVRAPVPQRVQVERPDGTVTETRSMTVSALCRVGPGYVLNHTNGLILIPSEDPEIDRKAADAEWTTDKADDKMWVMHKRNEHFVKLVKQSTRAVTHLLCGYGHDLTHEADKAGITLVVVRVKSVAKHCADLKREEEERAEEKRKADEQRKKDFIPLFSFPGE